MTNHNLAPLPTPTSIDDLEGIDDEMREALERMQALYTATESRSDHFQSLYAKGETEQLQGEVEDLAYELMETGDPEYQDLLQQRKTNPNANISGRVNEIAAMYVMFITNEAGLPDEARFTEIEQARNNVQKLYTEKLGRTPDDPQNALKALGIVQYNDEGKASYHFPHDFMPQSVNEKWDVYLASVCAHLTAAREHAENPDKERVELADKTRKYAHDSVTRDVHAILNLEGVKGWDFQNTRSLLASVREAVFPTGLKSDAEKKHASELLAHSGNHLRTAAALVHRNNH